MTVSILYSEKEIWKAMRNDSLSHWEARRLPSEAVYKCEREAISEKKPLNASGSEKYEEKSWKLETWGQKTLQKKEVATGNAEICL